MNLLYDPSSISRLQIELTTRCNASCPVCTRNFFGGPVVPDLEMTELSLSDIELMFPDEISRNLKSINYCGNLGDSILAKDVIPILEFFKSKSEHNLYQVIRTNGGIRSIDFWTKLGNFFKQPAVLSNNPFAHSGVVFSVDGLSDTNHIYRRGVLWDKLYANMKAYSEAGGYGVWEWLLFDHNRHQVEEAKKLANSLGFRLVLKNPLGYEDEKGNPRGAPVYNKSGEYEYTIFPINFKGEKTDQKWFGNVAKFSTSNEVNVFPTEHNKNLAKTSVIKCKSTNNLHGHEIFVTPSGHLLPCCYLGGPFSGVASNTIFSRKQFHEKIKALGIDKFDLKKHSMIDILNGPYFSKFFLDGWNADSIENGRLLYCVETCGECSTMDKLYVDKIPKTQISKVDNTQK